MRVLLINTDYPDFLGWMYDQQPALRGEGYDVQLAARRATRFGVADFYSRNLCRLGVEAAEVYANNCHLQRAWVRANLPRRQWPDVPATVAGTRRAPLAEPLRRLRRLFRRRLMRVAPDRWVYDVLARQIEGFRPDVIVNQNPRLDPRFFAEVSARGRLLVAQIASPLPPVEHFAPYSLILSSLPNLVDRLRSLGLPSELHRLAFEPEVLGDLSPHARDVPVSFVGQVSDAHAGRARLLAFVSRSVELQVWGPRPAVDVAGKLAAAWRGEAWGLEMYAVLRRSRVTLNHHIDVAGRFANNLRLYEATGVGAALVTDAKDNLHELFAPDEVVSYEGTEDCAEKLRYLLDHPEATEEIARRGQARTLRDHTYAQRMPELVEILRASAARRGV